MIVRAITGFLDPGWPLQPERIASLAGGLGAVRSALNEAGYEVQTLRLATPPPSEMNKPVPPADRPELARQLEAECFVHGIDYASLGPALPGEPQGYAVLPEILSAAENIFATGLIADPESGLSLDAARACARAIQSIAAISPDGFANLRFSALANVPPGGPFFPAAYHRGGPPALAIATEAADLAIDALHTVSSPHLARRRLISMIEAHAAALSRLTEPLATQHEIRYLGIDFSLAPYPENNRSLGTALEIFGAPICGLAGTAAAAAFFASCLDKAQFQRTGFCGLFLPVLEDSVLAARAAEGHLSVTDLLLYSTLCGTGLDVVPLPGDADVPSLSAVLVDLGAISLRHHKPLTARLMPIPGKKAGDEVQFSFPYFADSRVMALPARPLTGLLAGKGTLDIEPYL
jgi:hypothetical protein